MSPKSMTRKGLTTLSDLAHQRRGYLWCKRPPDNERALIWKISSYAYTLDTLPNGMKRLTKPMVG